MKESIKKIIKSILLIICVVIIAILYMNSLIDFQDLIESNHNNTGRGIQSRKIDINIRDNKLYCEDIIIFDMNTAKYIYYEFIQDNQYLSNVKICINNRENFSSMSWNMGINDGYIRLNEFLLDALNITNRNVTVKLTYELDKDYITRYTNTDVLSYFIDLKHVDYLNNLTLNLNSNVMISNLKTDKAEIINNGNEYIINMNNLKKSRNIDILFNINTKINNTVDSKYIDRQTLQDIDKYSYINERMNFLVIFIVVSIIIFIVSFIINKKMKVNKYRRETSELISPILAESIIDGKIGLKELIMTTIIELNIRGNIKIINNNMIELISLDNLELYEKNIVELLFRNNIIRFSDINNIFSESNKETLMFTSKMNQIKELILEKIFSMNIFSSKLTIINKIIEILAILININLPQLFLSNLTAGFIVIDILVVGYYIKKDIHQVTTQEEILNSNIPKNKNIFIVIIITLFASITTLINAIKYHFAFFVIILLVFILNLYTIYKSQATALTKKGKKEQLKLMELKRYMQDYSLIKNRDLQSVIIWDEYLAYATAFKMPNKITNTIYEEWYNLNLNLQIIAKILN